MFGETPLNGMDFSLETKVVTPYTDSASWIPRLDLGFHIRGVMYNDTLFACDRDTACKQLPIGHSEWINVSNFREGRNFMSLTAVDGKVLVSGGRSVGTAMIPWQGN